MALLKLIVHNLQSKVIDAEIIIGSHIGKRVFIPQITLSFRKSDINQNGSLLTIVSLFTWPTICCFIKSYIISVY